MVSKELLFHAGEIWFVRDLYAHYDGTCLRLPPAGEDGLG